MDLRTIIAQLGQLDEDRKVAGKAYGGSAQKDDDKEENHKRGAPEKKDMDTTGGADLQDFIGKKPKSKEVGKTSVTHKLKEFIEQVESSKKQLDEVALDQSQVAVPSIGATQPSATSRPAGNAQVGMKVIDFKDPNDPLKHALDQAVKNKEVTALGEENLEEVAPPGMEDWIKGRKEAFKKQYGDRWEGVLYATAWDEYNKKHKKDESMYESAESDKQPIMESVLEEILEAFPHEHKMCQEGWAMDEGLYEALCDHYYKEGRIPRKIWHGPLEELRKHVEGCYMEDTGVMHEAKKEYDFPPSMRKPATLDTVGVKPTVDLVPQQQANRELNKQLDMEPSMKKSAFETSQREFAFESWDSQLQSLLQEGLTVTTSTGGPMGQEDSVSVSASGEDAKSMMELLRNAGIGHGGAEASHDMGPEVTDQDEVLGQLGGQEHDDSGDTDLSFLKKMIGTPVEADCGCEEGQTQTASPGDAHMSPMANKMDEADVEEGNLFTKGLEDDNVKIGQKIPGTDAIKTKDIGESDDLGPVKDTGGKCNMVHKTSGKEIVVRDEPDVIKKYEAMGYKKQVGESDDEDHKDHTEKSSTGGRIERKDGVTKHHAGKHYGGSEDKDDDDEDIKEDSYDADDPTDVAGEKDERSEAMRDAGLAASYVPEEALDQPATFEGKSCMECGSPMEESAYECNECGYMESMHEDRMAEITIEKTPHGQLSVIKNGKQIATANYDSDSDSYWVFDPISKSDKAFDSKEEIIAHFSKHSMAESEVEEGYTFEGLFKKLAMIAEESTAEKDEHAEKAGKKVTKDIEYDEGHKGKNDAKAEKAGKKVTKDIEYDDKKDKEKVDEWANSPQNKLSDEEFQTEMNYMLQALSGGLNGPKVDNTTLPKTQVRPVAESESLDGWLRLAGIK